MGITCLLVSSGRVKKSKWSNLSKASSSTLEGPNHGSRCCVCVCVWGGGRGHSTCNWETTNSVGRHVSVVSGLVKHTRSQLLLEWVFRKVLERRWERGTNGMLQGSGSFSCILLQGRNEQSFRAQNTPQLSGRLCVHQRLLSGFLQVSLVSAALPRPVLDRRTFF